MKRFFAVLKARNFEFLRDRSALGWNVVFPVLVIFGFAFTFSGRSQNQYKVGVLGAFEGSPLQQTKYVEFVPFEEEGLALEKVKRHQIDLLYDADSKRYWINSTSPKAYLMEKILRGSIPEGLTRQEVEGKEIRYVDWLMPGLLAMNIMFSALFGVGYVIVRYRKNGVLKRLKATPLSAVEFLCAQIASRMILVVVVNVVVFVGCDFFLKFHMLGSYWTLFLVMVVGTFTLIALSLIMAARTSSEEFAGGVLNLISWPMMFLSGVWFSLEGANPYIKSIAQALPLTPMIDAARKVMVDGAGIAQISYELGLMTAMGLVFLAVGTMTFKWEA